MPNEIIVTARPYEVFMQTDTYTDLSGGSAAGPGVALAQVVISDMLAKDNVKIDPDVSTDEIVVIGQRIKTDLITIAASATISSHGGWGPQVNIPCIGWVKYAEIAGNAKNMSFQLTSQNFGPGRAGENLVGSDGLKVPIQMNATAALGYSQLTNGIMYLITHEIAHSLHAMQQYNNQQWQSFVSGADPSLTQAQLIAAYPNSPQFAANEARANTVARAIAKALGQGAMTPDPTHGYQIC